jgi:hypothetical protein
MLASMHQPASCTRSPTQASSQATDTSLFKIGLLQVWLTPNPFLVGGQHFNQTLDVGTGRVIVAAGGGGAGDEAAFLTVWVDANNDDVYIQVAAGPGSAGATYSLSASLVSVRPSQRFTYTAPFTCEGQWTADPDVSLPQLPPAWPSAAAASTVLYHRNNPPSDGDYFNATLCQIGMCHLVESLRPSSDRWYNNTFGVAMTGSSNMARVSATGLSSTAPDTAFTLRVSALTAQTTTADDWTAQLQVGRRVR